MKKIVLHFILLTFLYSCQDTTRKVSDYIKYSNISDAIQSKQGNLKSDTLLFGFYFGMSKEELNSNIQELKRVGIVKTDKLNSINEIRLKDENVKCKVIFGNLKGGLNSMKIEINESDFQKMLLFVKEELKNPNVIYIGKGFKDERYLWIKGNKKVEFFNNMSKTEISFEDLSNQQQRESENLIKNLVDKKNEVKIENSAWDGSVKQVKDYLKKNLKDPDSYESIEWSEITKNGDKRVVRHKYRAKNSLGGYMIINQVFTLDKDGNIINVTDIAE